jgi:ABC-type nickel/cobalt efflux system permease component RcnA
VRLALRATLLGALASLAVLAVPGAAGAHPLGNFSINHLTQISVSRDRIDVRYLLDQAEIPTFQERGRSDSAVLAAKRAEVARHLAVTVEGRPIGLTVTGASLTHPPGQGGLPLTRVELSLRAAARGAGRVAVHDGTFPGRVGWKAIVARPGAGTDVRSSAPSFDPTGGLRRYPQDSLSSPLDQRTATLTARSGDGRLTAPRGPGGRAETTGNRAGDGFAGLFADAASGHGVLIFLLLAAMAWGAVHALSPGHGKTMVAAYLVGTRGTARHALALGATVTVTHTAGVFALGLVTLALSQYVLPEQLYPWLNLASGLLVVFVGAGVLRGRVRRLRSRRHHHPHDHGPYDHDHHHHGPHDHDDHPHGTEDLTWRGLLGMGAAAGLLPCPSALVVLLAAIAQHQVALGLLMIVAFSLGLAGTLSALGLLVVLGGRMASRLRVPPAVSTALPALSAVVIVAAGFVLTVRALPQLT